MPPVCKKQLLLLRPPKTLEVFGEKHDHANTKKITNIKPEIFCFKLEMKNVLASSPAKNTEHFNNELFANISNHGMLHS